MSNLEEYIKQNLEAFDDQELPEGHFERFEAKLTGGEAGPSTELRDRPGNQLRDCPATWPKARQDLVVDRDRWSRRGCGGGRDIH